MLICKDLWIAPVVRSGAAMPGERPGFRATAGLGREATAKAMFDYTIQPLVGVGAVRFGMTPEEVRRAMPELSNPFRKGPTSRYETDAFHRNAFQVFYDGESPTVKFIELSRGLEVRAFYRDLEVFATPADEVVAYISRDAAYDQTDREIPYSYVFADCS